MAMRQRAQGKLLAPLAKTFVEQRVKQISLGGGIRGSLFGNLCRSFPKGRPLTLAGPKI